MSYYALLIAVFAMLTGCAGFRSVENSISTNLETIPVMRMIGIESRKSQEERARQAKQEERARQTKQEDRGITKDQVSTRQFAVIGSAMTGELVLLFRASNWINPNPMSESAPVRVFIFELQNFDKFNSAESTPLLTEPQKILGSDLRRVRELVLAPGEDFTLNWHVKQAGYIGVLADFRTPTATPLQNKQLIAIDGRASSTWEIRLSGNAVLAVARATTSRILH